MVTFDQNKEYDCGFDIKSYNLSYLQYLVINYKSTNNCLDLMKKDLEYNKQHYPNYINYKNSKGLTALTLACLNMEDNSTTLIDFLIDNGADINLKNNSNMTTMSYVVTYLKSIHMIEYLYNHGGILSINDLFELEDIKDDRKIIELFINRVNFEDISHIRDIYMDSVSNGYYLLASLLLERIIKNNKYDIFTKMYIFGNIRIGEYNQLISNKN